MSLAKFIILLLSISSIVILQNGIAHAEYDGARIIDDSVFLNAGSMNSSQIQNFLASKNSGLANRSFVLNCYGADSKERQWYSAIGAPCDQNIPASHIIFYSAQIYGVNPQVILATMQKEQSLITSPNPTTWQVNQAMGYGCPTTGQCGGNSTFFYQIDSGTWALRYHYERARKNYTWWNNNTGWTCGTEKNFYKPSLYPYQNVRFYDEDGVLYRTYYLQNPATSAFYCYTPHAYNNPQGLYGRAPFGTVGRYYSGSYNFVTYFELWFGSTKQNVESTGDRFNLRTFPSTEDSTVLRTVTRSEITTPICHQTGSNYIIDGSGGSTWVLVYSPSPGWVATDTSLYNQIINAGSKPCPIKVKPIYRAYNSIRQRHFWTGYQEERNFVLNVLRFGEGDPSFFAIDEAKTQGKPVYRLYNAARETHFWTTDLNEKNFVINKLGFKDEGYAYSVSYGGPNTIPVYRLYDRRNERHFWTADINERNFVINQLGFELEGEAFRVPK